MIVENKIYRTVFTLCSWAHPRIVDCNALFCCTSAEKKSQCRSNDKNSFHGEYILPFHVTPLPETTFHVDASIIAAKIPAPSGVVNAYHADISSFLSTFARS